MKCHDSRLHVLLQADEDSAEFNNASAHVESCSRCQERLLELSGDTALLQEFGDTLKGVEDSEPYEGCGAGSVVISVESTVGDDGGAEYEPVSLDFLSPPSHPEMLGRLGRYEIERVIGSGGMGVVLKGFDTELHRVVAIKVLKPHLAHNGSARRRFSREAQSAAAVVHEHVVPIHDVLSDAETPFLVMQYVPGQSLQARVDDRGPLDTKEILRIARQAAAGLAAAHAQGVVHRDVKPANILLEESVDRALITDFGLARTVDDATLTRTGVIAGTPHYMSPEQAAGSAVDQRSDLFSLGSAIYFMCTGRPPFRADHTLAILNRICNDAHRPADEVNSDVPAELADVVDCLLSKNPNDRFKDAEEVEQRLESILQTLQHGRSSRRLHWQRMWRRWRHVVRRSAITVTAVLACLAVGAFFARWTLAPAVFEIVDRPGELTESTALIDSTPSIPLSVVAEEPEVVEPSAIVDVDLPPDTFDADLKQAIGLLNELESNWNGLSEQSASVAEPSTDWSKDLAETQGMIDVIEVE